jgi:hypothetical protein
MITRNSHTIKSKAAQGFQWLKSQLPAAEKKAEK